jgi:hypothetical protein
MGGCKYDPGEVAKSYTAPGILDPDITFAAYHGIKDKVDPDAVLIGDFGVGSATLKPSAAAELKNNGWIANWDTATGSPLEVLGYTDCSGEETDNAPLRFKRGQNVAAFFPQARANMKSVGAARMDEFLADNSTSAGRAYSAGGSPHPRRSRRPRRNPTRNPSRSP